MKVLIAVTVVIIVVFRTSVATYSTDAITVYSHTQTNQLARHVLCRCIFWVIQVYIVPFFVTENPSVAITAHVVIRVHFTDFGHYLFTKAIAPV